MLAQFQPGVLVTWALVALSFTAQCHGRTLAGDTTAGNTKGNHVTKAIGIGISITKNKDNQQGQTQSDARRKLQSPGGCSDSDSSVHAVLECTNAVRANPDGFAGDYPCHYDSWKHEVQGKNFPALKVHGMLTQVAQMHSDDQARSDHMSHSGSDGSSLGMRVDRSGFDWGKIGENVAVGYDSAKEVVMAWMCSPTHRKNVMNCNYNLLGIGCSWSQKGLHYFTQNFGCAADDVCECGAYHQPTPEPYVEPYMKKQFNMYPMYNGGMYRDQSDEKNNQWFTDGHNGQHDVNNNHHVQVDQMSQEFPDNSHEGNQPHDQRGSLRDQFDSCSPGDPTCSRMQVRPELRASRQSQMQG